MKGLTRQIVLLMSAVAMVIANLVFGEGGDDLMTAVMPAGFTFIVWLPIFVGTTIFGVYQALPAQRDDERFDALGWLMTGRFSPTPSTRLSPSA